MLCTQSSCRTKLWYTLWYTLWHYSALHDIFLYGDKVDLHILARESFVMYFFISCCIYLAGQSIRWYITWSLAKGIRSWFRGLPPPYCCIPIYTYGLWVASWVRQGLNDFPWISFIQMKELDQCKYIPFISHINACDFQVIALDVDLPVKQAFHIMHEQVSLIMIPCVPNLFS